MAESAKLQVTSHVGRDILASAAVFKTEAAVVWEYVVNSLQYVAKGVSPNVQVIVDTKRKTIEIHDNGVGMSASDLSHYFTMHGENRERVAGRPGRGKFGTGKSAAFGIAGTLRVETRRAGLCNVVELTREKIEASRGDAIPLDWVVRNEATALADGTIVKIERVLLERVDTTSIIEYIERHLGAFRGKNPEVAVNDHVCEYREPKISQTFSFRPSSAQQEVLGDVELIVHVAQAPLRDQEQGIAITAGPGNLVAIERAGMDRKEYGSYLFGEIDVVALETYPTPIDAYDATRSLQLNQKHPVVRTLVSFLGSKLELVRKQLVAQANEARKTEDARRLAAEAQRIATLLNEDFARIHRRLEGIRAAAPGASAALARVRGSHGGDSAARVEGGDEAGRLDTTGTGKEGTGGKGRTAPDVPRRGEADSDGDNSVSPAGPRGGNRQRASGGFSVEFSAIGSEEDRSKYDRGRMQIVINTEHPVVQAALRNGSVEDPVFRRLAYEIAFSEYAIALGYELLRQDPNMPGEDLMYEVRTSLNRIARQAATLYA